MKKVFAFLLVAALALSLAGCGAAPAETADPAVTMTAVAARSTGESLIEAAKRAEEVLKANKAVLDKLAEELLAHETLEEKELEPILKNTKLPETAKLY